MSSLESKSGISIKSSVSRSWFKHLSWRMLDVRLHRMISGSGASAILLKASSVYNRKHIPIPYDQMFT